MLASGFQATGNTLCELGVDHGMPDENNHATDEEVSYVFRKIQENLSPDQWSRFVHAVQDMEANGLAKIRVSELVSVVESIIIQDEDGMTIEDLENLGHG